jgi:hypothetical protein
MNKSIFMGGILLLAVAFSSCSAPPEPVVTPPQPVFVTSSNPPEPVDHGIYADVGIQNAIDIEWKPDSSHNTSGYLLYRSTGDSSVDSDGLLTNRVTVADIETSNQLIQPLDTSYRDTLGIAPGATYYYQLQAFYRSPTNTLTYSKPTHVGLSTSFTFANRVLLQSPNGSVSLNGIQLQFIWQDLNSGGLYQIIVQRLDSVGYVWSAMQNDFGNPQTVLYPTSATPLVAGGSYQWRVKYIAQFGGSTSVWMGFTITP